MGKIYLIRHGQSEDNAAGILGGRRDSALTELGIRQAKKAAETISDRDINLIYSSPLRRALTTAEIIADIAGIKELKKDDRLVERDFGILTGRPYSDIYALASGILETDKIKYFLDAPEAETFPQAYERGKIFIEEIRSRHANEDILIVAHGDIGQMIRAAYLGKSWEKGLDMPYPKNTDICDLSFSDIQI